MTLLQTGPAVGLALYVAGTVALSQGVGSSFRRRWILPAALSCTFFGFSVYTVRKEGPYGFWPEHIRNLWGNQIWYDLLLAGACSYATLVPRARAVGMNPFTWLLGVLATGSVGLYAMLARILQLEEEAQKRD